MILAEHDKNRVYFSNLFAESYPTIWKEICEVFARYNYTAGRLTYTKDYWCRDFMPIQVGKCKFVQFRYDPDYLADIRRFITKVDNTLNHFSDFAAEVSKSNLVVDGGNIVACTNAKGEAWVVMTEKVFEENHEFSKEDIVTLLESKLGAKIVWLPWTGTKLDEYGHTDGIVNFIDGTTDRPSIMAYFSLYPKKIATQMRRRLNKVFEVHELSFTKDEKNNWAYVNLLRTRDFIIVPGLGTGSDLEAMEQIAKLYPKYEGRIHQINIASVVEKFNGAFNCLTWTVNI